MKKIIYISGTRAEYGIMSNLLKKLNRLPSFDVSVIVTGMHLMKKFGYSVKETRKDRLNIIAINSVFKENKSSSMLYFLSDFIEKLTKKIEKLKPDMIFILGDRVEALAGAVVGAYLSIPVVHFHGGEISSTIDDITRHTITKLSHIHLCATKKSAQRIIKMGEELYRVKVVGAPSLDNIKNLKIISKRRLYKALGFKENEPLILVLQHPTTSENKESYMQMCNILIAIQNLGHQSLIIYPNADPGSSGIIKAINKFRHNPKFVIKKNLSYKEYISVMTYADAIIGNSSSGIIEAPYFKLPFVNIGSRQNGRERSKNVIDCDYDKNKIKKSITYALSSEFRNKIKNLKNPYGGGATFRNVVNVLKNTKIDRKLLQKTITY